MHTSTVLRPADFRYMRHHADGSVDASFQAFCPDYHESDRIGVVSPCLEDGIVHTAYALLALTTMFYDALRAGAPDFFDYPRHFALIGATAGRFHAGNTTLPIAEAPLGATWGNLDVWPDSQWLYAPATATGILKQVFTAQLDRVFWPQDLRPGPDAGTLPIYVRKLLRTRLKSVYYYNTPPPNFEIEATPPVEALAQSSRERLPLPVESGHSYREGYRQVPVEEFLEGVGACFVQE